MGAAIFLGGTLLLTTLIVVGTHKSNRLLREWGGVPFNPLLAPAENGLKLLLLALLVALALGSGLPPEQFGLVPLTGAALLLGLLAGVAGWAASNLIATLAIARYGREVIPTLVLRAILPRSGGEWLGVLPAMALAVLLEELLFRAILIGGMSAWVPLPPLLLLNALLFGVLHSIQGQLGTLVTGALGLALAGLLLWSGSLWPPLIAHYVINLGQLILATRDPALRANIK